MRSCQAMIGVPSTARRLVCISRLPRGMAVPAPRSRRARGPLADDQQQDRRQRVAHVVLDIVGKHTQEDVRFHAMLEPMVHGPHLQIDTFQRAEGPLDQRQVLVRRHRGLGTDFVRRQTGAYHIDAVEPRLGCGLLLPAVEH